MIGFMPAGTGSIEFAGNVWCGRFDDRRKIWNDGGNIGSYKPEAALRIWVTFTVSSLTTGVTVIMGQYLGEKRPERLGGTGRQEQRASFLLFRWFLTAVLLIFARPIAILMQAPESALDLTVTYIRICGAGCTYFIYILSAVFSVDSVIRGCLFYL